MARVNLNSIPKFIIYQYYHIDDLSLVRSPHDYFRENDESEIASAKDAIAQKFLDAGWEGDGEIGVIWIPPFADAGVEDTFGLDVWHVKQDNNGTSFLASPVELPYKRIAHYNAHS